MTLHCANTIMRTMNREGAALPHHVVNTRTGRTPTTYRPAYHIGVAQQQQQHAHAKTPQLPYTVIHPGVDTAPVGAGTIPVTFAYSLCVASGGDSPPMQHWHGHGQYTSQAAWPVHTHAPYTPMVSIAGWPNGGGKQPCLPARTHSLSIGVKSLASVDWRQPACDLFLFDISPCRGPFGRGIECNPLWGPMPCRT